MRGINTKWFQKLDNDMYCRILLHVVLDTGKIYVCFVDFKRAFHSVNRRKLWAVLKTNGFKGNLMKVIKSMYEGVKMCVRVDADYTDYFNCNEGLKQGCLLSPILFSMFVNEFTKIIETSDLRGI